MALKFTRWVVILAAVVFVLVTPSAVYTCGPFFEAAVFSPGQSPQLSQPDFAAGKLGIVLPTFRRSYLIVAYRYLNGLKLASEQQQDAIDVWNRNVGPNPENNDRSAIEVWSKARSQVSGLPPEPAYGAYAPVSLEQPYQTFLNCPNEAFKTAASTLQARIQKYSASSSAIRDWIAAQDQVFSNCAGKAHLIPAVLNSSDSLLRADRDYQIATAQFYAREFDSAAASFDAIGKDASSPWSRIGSYLAARAFIRKANLASPEYDKFDAALMKAAQERLEKVLQDPGAGPMHEATRRLLDYVRFRTESSKRAAELEQIMLKPDPGPEFRQHLWDYSLLVSRGGQAGDLSDWFHTFSSDWSSAAGVSTRPEAKSGAEHAFAQWRSEHSLPWLIAALALTNANDPNSDEVLKAAAQVSAKSPGYLTVRYFALRLMEARKQDDAARKELDTLLSQPPADLAPGTRNLLNDERQKLVTSLPDFLAHAAEVPATVGIDYGVDDNEEADVPEKPQPAAEKPYFNAYSAGVLSRRLPLALMVESAQFSALPIHLRREIARSAWLRAVLLGDQPVAGKLQPVIEELDHPLWKTMEPFRSAGTDSERHFTALFITLQNPGLIPYVREGLLRKATLGEIDNFRDNWWCADPGMGGANTGRNPKPDLPAPAFLPEADKNRAQQEQEKLAAIGFAPNYLTSEVLTYAKQHPDDPRVPQALHLAVRATRYGCTNPDTTHLSEAAFNLLHQQYPKSEWAEKTKYHY